MYSFVHSLFRIYSDEYVHFPFHTCQYFSSPVKYYRIVGCKGNNRMVAFPGRICNIIRYMASDRWKCCRFFRYTLFYTWSYIYEIQKQTALPAFHFCYSHSAIIHTVNEFQIAFFSLRIRNSNCIYNTYRKEIQKRYK